MHVEPHGRRERQEDIPRLPTLKSRISRGRLAAQRVRRSRFSRFTLPHRAPSTCSMRQSCQLTTGPRASPFLPGRDTLFNALDVDRDLFDAQLRLPATRRRPFPSRTFHGQRVERSRRGTGAPDLFGPLREKTHSVCPCARAAAPTTVFLRFARSNPGPAIASGGGGGLEQ